MDRNSPGDRVPVDPASIVHGMPPGHEHARDAALMVHDVTVAYDRRPVLFAIDLDVPAGCLCAVVGPNGSGKTTLLRGCLGLVPLAAGHVRMLGGQRLDQVRADVAYVPQRESVDWDFPVSVRDVVRMGRLPHRRWFGRMTAEDHRRVDEAMARVEIGDLADRQIGRLSGGQQQRVFLARALAQDARLYFMDEPFAAVDATTERAILDVLRDLRRQGRTVIAVHHDLPTVAAFFDRAILLNQRLVAYGPVDEVLTPVHLERAYGGRLVPLAAAADALRTQAGG